MEKLSGVFAKSVSLRGNGYQSGGFESPIQGMWILTIRYSKGGFWVFIFELHCANNQRV